MTAPDIILYQQAIGCPIEDIEQLIKDTLAKTEVNDFRIVSRVKNPKNLEKKKGLKQVTSVLEIEDVYALRVLVKTERHIYTVSEIIAKSFRHYIDHNFIQNPKILPHQTHLPSLRLLQIIAYRNDIPFEIQITTFEYHEVNESLHQRYHQRTYG